MSTNKKINKGNFLVSLTMLIVVAIVFTITVVTYAWYAQQTKVDSSGASLTSAGLNASLVVTGDPQGDFAPYDGQSGIKKDGTKDEVYIAKKSYSYFFTTTATDYYFFVDFNQITITLLDGRVYDSKSDTSVRPSFTYRIKINGREYMPESESNFVVDAETKERLNITTDTNLQIEFYIVFLDETSYQSYLNDYLLSVNAFRYCGYEFMKSVFSFEFTLGFASDPSAQTPDPTPGAEQNSEAQ